MYSAFLNAESAFCICSLDTEIYGYGLKYQGLILAYFMLQIWSIWRAFEFIPNFIFLCVCFKIHISHMVKRNYFTGMDAQVSYAFHSARKQNPEKFKNQLVNQVHICLLYLLPCCMI